MACILITIIRSLFTRHTRTHARTYTLRIYRVVQCYNSIYYSMEKFHARSLHIDSCIVNVAFNLTMSHKEANATANNLIHATSIITIKIVSLIKCFHHYDSFTSKVFFQWILWCDTKQDQYWREGGREREIKKCKNSIKNN